MADEEPLSEGSKPRDSGSWARPVERLQTNDAPEGAWNLNVQGLQVVGPLQGFGQLWKRTYSVRLAGAGVTPAQVIRDWKQNLPRFMPPESRFYPSLAGIEPGQVVLINATVLGMPVSTGVLVLFADDESFAVMTPEGHPESGFNTFSAYEDEGTTVAQIQSLGRANDPVYELGYRFLGGTRIQEQIWTHVLESLAAHYGVRGQVQLQFVCVDPQLQWSYATNIWRNAQIRTMLYALSYPLRRLMNLRRRSLKTTGAEAISRPPGPEPAGDEEQNARADEPLEVDIVLPAPATTPEEDAGVEVIGTVSGAVSEMRPGDAAFWAQTVERLDVSNVPPEANRMNVQGRRATGPLQGFGQMWQKTYRVRLSGAEVAPTTLIQVWKQHFPEFWPPGARFYAPLTGIAPGEVAVLTVVVDPREMVALSTGVMVLYADDESFTFMTPEGHMFAGWITFSAREEEGATVAQIDVLIRASDPLYELGMVLGASRQEDLFWEQTLIRLAAYFGVYGQPQTIVTCVDPRRQWRYAGNVWQNAAIRTTLYRLAAPVRVGYALSRRALAAIR
jgi:hypothetical protein